MQCSHQDSKGWRCKKETDLGYKRCYDCRGIVRRSLARLRKRLGNVVCDRCFHGSRVNGLVICEACIPKRALANLKYRKSHKELVNENVRIWMRRYRLGQPTTNVRRQQAIDRAEVDR